jgi:pSer/pThr/pTyr-binding forkhead associated (FHA) protein
MNCSNCGRQNPLSALFCLDCGQKLREIGAPPPAAPAPASGPFAQSAPAPASVAPAPAAPVVMAPVAMAPVAMAPAAPQTASASAAPVLDRCARCGADNPAHMKFCRMCGASMAREQGQAQAPAPSAPSTTSCPRCSTTIERGAAFCGVCGLSMTDMFPAVSAAAMPSSGSAYAKPVLMAAPVPAQPARIEPLPPTPIASAAPSPVGVSDASGPGFAGMPSPGASPAVSAPQPALPPVLLDKPAPPPPPSLTPSSGVAPASSATVSAVASLEVPVAKLVTILKDGSEGQTYRISSASTDIGRSEGAILLGDDPYLSARHARISTKDGQYFLRDLGSVNGVFRKLREPAVLSHGDVVLLGQQVLRLEVLAEHETSFGPVSHFGVMLFGTPEQPRVARLVQLTTEGIPRDVYHLHRDETVIGRESGDVVFTDDAFLSRRHASFRVDRAQRKVVVTDLGSSNGTLVQFRGEREMHDGDVYRLGQHLFRFDLPGRARAGGVAGR